MAMAKEERKPLMASVVAPPQVLPAAPQLERQFPMFVLPFDDLLALESFAPHEEMRPQLVEWKAGMGDVLFVSHTWLGSSHPDPHGLKLHLVQHLVKRMRQKRRHVEGHFVAQAWYGSKRVRVTASAMHRCKYLWFDYLSVPQRDPDAQAKAIQSIFSYVNDAALFVVVAGPWKNLETDQWRDCRQWMRRGWCRLEMLANALSPRVKQVVLAESAASITSHGPSGLFGQQWFTSPVGLADFSVERDRETLGRVVLAMLESRKALALAQDDLLTYRFIHALSAKTLAGTGTSVPSEASLDEWMAGMRFKSVADGKATGWTPLMFAVVSGRVELCEWLLDAGANPRSIMRQGYAQYALRKGTPVLHAACLIHDSPEIVRLLIRRGADPFKRMPSFPYKPASHQAAGFGHVGNIDALAEHSPKLLEQKDYFGFTFAMAVAYAHDIADSAKHVLSEHRAVVAKEVQESGCALCGLAVEEVGGLDTLRALLEAGCDPNRNEAHEPAFSAFNLMNKALSTYEALGGSSHTMLEASYTWSSPALHVASIRGNLGAIELLLEHGAEVNLASNTTYSRQTALHLAAWQGHATCCQKLLEHGADPRARDRRGWTPAKWAERAGQPDVAKMLRDSEALGEHVLYVTGGEGGASVEYDPVEPAAGAEVMAAVRDGEQ